jgi:nickel-type superoxide dismutase maturation protease
MSRMGLTGLLLVLLALAAARRRLDIVEVRGRSMAPTLLPGDRLVVVRAPPRTGDVVLARDPREPRRELIKRVTRIGPAGVRLHGDNPLASTDARAFGAVAQADVGWRAVLRWWPLERAGPIPHMPREEGGEPACTFPEALIAGG